MGSACRRSRCIARDSIRHWYPRRKTFLEHRHFERIRQPEQSQCRFRLGSRSSGRSAGDMVYVILWRWHFMPWRLTGSALMMQRLVEPELLDSLPADHPEAIRSRRDLRIINRWMGNARHLARAIYSIEPPPRKVLELGTGDGTLLLQLANSFREP